MSLGSSSPATLFFLLVTSFTVTPEGAHKREHLSGYVRLCRTPRHFAPLVPNLTYHTLYKESYGGLSCLRLPKNQTPSPEEQERAAEQLVYFPRE